MLYKEIAVPQRSPNDTKWRVSYMGRSASKPCKAVSDDKVFEIMTHWRIFCLIRQDGGNSNNPAPIYLLKLSGYYLFLLAPFNCSADSDALL